MPVIKFESVKSSQIREIGHEGETLYIKFRSKKIYSYYPVTKEKFNEFKNSSSLGKYFHQEFKMNSKLLIKENKDIK